jgi:YD repeat-containing protein
VGFVRKLRSRVLLTTVALGAMGAGTAGCLADPMLPCEAFEPGAAAENTVVRAFQGPIAAMAMNDAFVLRNVCDPATDECHLESLLLPELSPGSQVMLTTDGRWLVGIDHESGDVWTYSFDAYGKRGTKQNTYVHETDGPAQLVIGVRDSDRLIVRDRSDRLAVYSPGDQVALPIARDLGEYLRLAAIGVHHVVVRVPTHDGLQRLYVVDVDDPDQYHLVATGEFTSVVLGPGDGSLVVSEGHGADASVLVFDVESGELLDAFSGDLVSSRAQNDHRALEEVPGLHALAPAGDQLAYRTAAGSLAVRQLELQTSCVVHDTNRMGTGREPTGGDGNHAVAGFAADGMVYAEYTVGASQSFVYAYDPRNQQIAPLGAEDGDWHLAAVPGRVTDEHGQPEHIWAVGVRRGSHASIGQDRVDGEAVGRELTFMPMDDDGVWAIDTKDEIVGERRSERALSVRRVAPPAWANGRLRFEQGSDEQVVDKWRDLDGDEDLDNDGPVRVPLTGRLCLSTGTPGAWAYKCGDSTGGRDAITTNSGEQEQLGDPNVRPEFDPPFPDQGDGEGEPSADDPGEKDEGPTRG